ncbi:MAG: MFS transporter [Roseburia sp.]|nr:MFS transporter [Roseburia sp.]
MRIKFSIQKLNRDTWKFVQFQVLFTGMSSILTLFINTFLLQSFGSFSKEVLFYNMILALVQPIAMLTAMKMTEVKNALFTQRVGFVFYATALLVMCILGEAVSPLYPLFAVMLSFGTGYYFTVYSGQMLCYTNDSNRDQIAGMLTLLSSVISIFLPLLSGLIISRFGTHIGYRVVFGIAALLAAGALVTNMYLPAIPKHKKEPVLFVVARKILGNKNGRLIMLANGLSNCHGFTLPIFVTLLFYNLLPDELMISLNSTIGAVVGLLGAAVYAGTVKNRDRGKASILAAVAVMIPSLGMLIGLNVIVLIVFNSINGFFYVFQSTPILNTHFKVVEALGLYGEYGQEVHLIREVFVSAGRVLGLLLVWAVPQTNVGGSGCADAFDVDYFDRCYYYPKN